MTNYYRLVNRVYTTIFIFWVMTPFIWAQEGRSLRLPWFLGNVILIAFATGFIALACKSSRRAFSAIPDETGRLPDAKSAKKKRAKIDFSKGPIVHPEAGSALGWSIAALFFGILLFVSIPKANTIYQEIKNDPRFLGEGTALAAVVINYVSLGLIALLFISTLIMVIVVAVAGGGAAQ